LSAEGGYAPRNTNSPAFAQGGSKNLLKNDSFLPIFAQKARILGVFAKKDRIIMPLIR